MMEESVLDPWIQFFKTILDMPCPDELGTPTEDTEETSRRNKEIFWKIKGITAKATYRMFMKYGEPSTVDQRSALTKTFSNSFMLKYSIPLLESHLPILLSRKEKFVGSKALNYAIKFVSISTKP